MRSFFAARGRCALDLSAERPSCPPRTPGLLEARGFARLHVDMTAAARSRIGASRYRRGARLADAPKVFDCSSFIKWLYGLRGIWLPRRSIQQFGVGMPVGRDELREGDLLFWSGTRNYYIDDPALGIGHVGYCTGGGIMIHAAGPRTGITETPVAAYERRHAFRGARRIITHPETTVTFRIPPGDETESSDDLIWRALQLMHQEPARAA